MRDFTHIRICIALTLVLIIFYFYWTKYVNVVNNEIPSTHNKLVHQTDPLLHVKKNEVYLAVVCCGDRFRETLTMLKSAIMFTKSKVNIIVVTEENLIDSFIEKLSEWQEITKDAFNYRVMPLTFPVENAYEWKRLFKPCAAQRLFLPSVLNNIDSILYVDTDILFLGPTESVWDHFQQFNSSQMVAVAPESEDPNVGWYNRFARHPFYGPLGVNSGVMLMNLTRMRDFKWVDYVIPIYKKYKLKITWGDQDIINIIFHFHSDKLYLYSCRYNFRPDHCMYMSVCKPAEQDGVAVIHGSRGFFHSENQPVFKAIFRAFEEFTIGGNLNQEFYQPLEAFLDLTSESNCGHIKEVYLKNVKKYCDVKDDTVK